MSRATKTEVGVVYRRGRQLHLALDQDLLVCGVGGRFRRSRRRGTDAVARGVSVQDLCASWGIAAEELDAWVLEHLPRPAPRPTRGKRRRSRERRDVGGLELRLHRIAG